MDYQRPSDFSNRETSDNYFLQGRLTGQPSANQHTSISSSDRGTNSYSSSGEYNGQRSVDRYHQYQRTTGQQSFNQHDQARRISTDSSNRRTVPSSFSHRPVEQHSTDRYGQYQRSTEDSSQSQSSGYSSQRRPTGQPSANQYGQRPSSNPSNTSNRRFESYTPSRRPADRYGQYQRPMQERNQRPSPQQSVNASDRNTSAYSPSLRSAEQRPIDRQGQYRQSTQESRPATQLNKSFISNPDSKKVSRNQSGNHHNQYSPDKKTHRKIPMKTIIIGVAALLVLSVFVVIRMKRDGGSISLPTDVPGEAEVTYNYIEDDQIVKKELIGTEFSFNNSVASGTMKYRFKNVTAYDNIYNLCGQELKENIEFPKQFKIDWYNCGCSYADDGIKNYEGYTKRVEHKDKTISYLYKYPDIFDTETGLFRFDCHIFVFEIELINVNAKSDTTDANIKNSNEFRISAMFNLVNRSGEKPYYGEPCYFAEELNENSDNESDGLSYHVIINPGETKTIHLGYFLIGDESEHPYSRMGLADEGHTSTYDDSTVFLWFDMSDVISKEQE